jgi:hypothetical protein
MEYSPAEIVALFENPNGVDAVDIARIVSAFFPTIKEALLAYDKITEGKKVKPIPMVD